MMQFILGALAGGFAAWWWRSDIQHYIDERLPNVRSKAADRLSALEKRAEEALGRAKDKIERMRSAGDQSRREMSSSGRSTGSYTQGTGV